MQIRLGGEWRTPTQCRVRFNGAWRRIAAIKMYADGAWRTVATFSSPSTGGSSGGGSTGGSTGGSSGGSGGGGGGTTFTAAASPSTVQWLSNGFFYNAGPVTVTPSGGTAPYTYSWVIGDDTGTVLNPTSATTSFRHGAAEIASTTAQCTVTDAVGRTAVSNTVTIFL